MPEPCEECGIEDALDRHAAMCPRALRLGLNRLAEGEEPIAPEEEAPLPEDTLAADDPSTEAPPVREGPSPEPEPDEWHEPGEHPASTLSTGLWFAYTRCTAPIGTGAKYISEFDAVVYDSELDALRYAVEHGWKVRPLEMGRSIREQAEDV